VYSIIWSNSDFWKYII